MAKKIFFELEFEGTDKVLNRAEQLRNAIKAIGTQLKDDALTDTVYTKLEEDLAKVKAELKDVEQERQNQVRAFQAGNAGDKSYLQLNATLIELRQQFKRLSEDERNSDLGKSLTKEIQLLDKELKDIDASIGQFQRNVGNYPTSLGQLIGGIGQSVPQLGGVSDAFGSISEGLDGIGQSATASGKLIAGAFLGFQLLSQSFQFLSESVAAFDDADQSAAQLEASLTATGQAAGITAEEINKISADRQKVTIFDDDDTNKAAGILLTFTNIKKGVFEDAIPAIQDLSTKLGGDLQGATIQVGKALNDPIKGITALSKAGVSFSEEQKGMIETLVNTGRTAEAQKIILGELNKEFGGSAEAAAKAGTGGLKVMENQLGAVKERIGELIVKGLEKLYPYLNSAVRGFGVFVEVLAQTPKFLYDNRIALYSLIAAMIAFNSQSIIAQGVILRENALKVLSVIRTNAQTLSQLSLNAAMKANPIGFVVGLVALLVGAFSALYQNSETVRLSINNLTNKFLAFYDGLGVFKTAFAQVVEPLKFAYYLFTDGAVAVEAYKDTVIAMASNAGIQFQNLMLRARALATQLDLTFSVRGATKEKLRNDLQDIENQIANNSKNIVDADKIFNEKLRVGREVAAQKQEEEEKKNSTGGAGLPTPDELAKKRKDLLQEVEKWNAERLKLAKKLVDDLAKAQTENIDSELQKQLAQERLAYNEKLNALSENYEAAKQKVTEQEKKVLEIYKTSSTEYKNFKSESTAELANLQKYNDLISQELLKTSNEKIIEIQAKFEEKRVSQMKELSERTNNELLKLTRQRIDLELELTDNQRDLNLQKLRLDKEQVLKALQDENQKRIDSENKAREELVKVYGVGTSEVLAFDAAANEKKTEITKSYQKNALLIEEKYLQDKEGINAKYLESESTKQLTALKARLEQRESVLNSDNTIAKTDLNVGVNAAKKDNNKELELELNVKFNEEKFNREKLTITESLDDVKKRLNDFENGDVVSVNTDEYKSLQEQAENYYNKLSELELQHTEQVAAEAKARIDLSIAEFERAGTTISDIIGAFDTLVKAQAAAEQEVINEQIQAKEQQVKKIESDLKNATGVQKIELQKQLENEKAAIQKLTEEKEAAEKRAAQTAKTFAIIQATIQTALNVVKALGTPPAPNFVAAAIAGGLGAIQIAAISAQPAAFGGLMGADVEPITLSGTRITSNANIDSTKDGDNILAVVRRGEVVLNERQQAMLGGASTFSAIGVPGFAFGGAISDVLPSPQISRTDVAIEEQRNMYNALLETISVTNSRIDNIKAYVLIDDITNVNQNDISIKSKAQL